MDTAARTARPARDPSRHAAPQIFDYLRERIITLEMPPGTLISRAELQDLFGFSSTPVRDALLKLQEEQLVEIFPQHATVVSPIDLELAQQAHFLRRSIELEAVRTVALRDDRAEIAARMAGVVAQQAERLARGDLPGFDAGDREFHRVLFDATGIHSLWLMSRRYAGHIDRIRRLHLPMPGKAERVLSEHRAVAGAVRAGDAAGAQEALRTHLSNSLAYAPDLVALWPAYFRS